MYSPVNSNNSQSKLVIGTSPLRKIDQIIKIITIYKNIYYIYYNYKLGRHLAGGADGGTEDAGGTDQHIQ